MKSFAANGVITAGCGRRSTIEIECEAKDRDHAKRKFGKYRRIHIGDTRWQVRLDLRSVRKVKLPSPCLAVRSQQLAQARY